MEAHEEYYFDDGDVAVIVEQTVFRVHSVILKLASGFFKARLSGSWQSPVENNANTATMVATSAVAAAATDLGENPANALPTLQECPHQIRLDDENPDDIALLLSVIYPNPRGVVSWESVAALMRLSDKYLVDVVSRDIRRFLETRWSENVFQSILLADRFLIADVYRKASTHIVDDLHRYAEEAGFRELSAPTLYKLYECRLRAIEYLLAIPYPAYFDVCEQCDVTAAARMLRLVPNNSKKSITAILEAMANAAITCSRPVSKLPYSNLDECKMKFRSKLRGFLEEKFGTAAPTIECVPNLFIELE